MWTWHLLACHHVNRIQWVNEGQLVYIVMWHWYYEEDRPLSISMRPLTHWSLVTHICVSEVGHRHHCNHSGNGLSPEDTKPSPEPILTYCQLDPQEKKLQSNSNQNSNIFIEQNAFENVVCSLSPNCHGLNVLTVPALHMSMLFSCHQESLLWILMWEWYYNTARSCLYPCQWEPNIDWHGVMSTRVGEFLSPRWPRYWHGTESIVDVGPISVSINSLRPRLNRRPFADDIFKCIFLNENEWILPRISLKFVLKVRFNNIPALFQIMAWCRPGDKPLSEPMTVSSLTHVCVTWPQWVKAISCNIASRTYIVYFDITISQWINESTVCCRR